MQFCSPSLTFLPEGGICHQLLGSHLHQRDHGDPLLVEEGHHMFKHPQMQAIVGYIAGHMLSVIKRI